MGQLVNRNHVSVEDSLGGQAANVSLECSIMAVHIHDTIRTGWGWTRLPSVWSIAAVAIALPIAVPIVAIMLTLFSPTSEVWSHLRETVLFEYIFNTVALLIYVAVLSTVLGVGCAWLTATKEFPARRIFVWALILPLASPAYVVAYAYADMLAYSSPILTWLREFATIDLSFMSVRSLLGAGFILSVTLYPYVYLFSYNAFAEHAGALTEASRTLGNSRTRTFWRVTLPHSRPAIVGGLALVLMETAADFGVVDYFGVPTLTNGIFRTWYAMGEHQAAMQLACWLFFIVALLVVLEQLARRGLHANPVSRNAPPTRKRMTGWGAVLACLACVTPITLGLILPASILLGHAFQTGDPTFGRDFIQFVTNSVSVAGVTSVITVICAICLVYAIRLRGDRLLPRISVRTATLGYAIPGLVLAVGLIGPLTWVDKALASWFQSFFNANIGLLLTGSVVVLVFVYVARFLTIAFNSVESGMARIHPNYDDAARSLGAKPLRLLRHIHLPLLYPTCLTAMLLVFVDVIKELPATLILRPFNFETLATRAYRLASDERIAEASTACLLIIVVGLLATVILATQNFGIRQRTLNS